MFENQSKIIFILPARTYIDISREFLIVENNRTVYLLDLTAGFGVQTNAKLTPISKLREKSKICIQSCLYTITLTPIFA